MGDRPVPRGRGAALLEALKRRQEREIGVQSTEENKEEPPKPRGRAALLQRLQESRKAKVGGGGDAQTTSAPSASTSSVQEITKSVQELSIEPKPPVIFKGNSGKPIRISANFIRLHAQKDRGVYEYEVKFDPGIDAKNRRTKLINIIMKEMGNVKVYDGGSALYLPSRLIETEKTFIGHLPGVDGDLEVKTTIIYKRKKRMGECLHLYNVLFKRIMYILLYTQMGRNYFSPSHSYLIPQHKLEVYPGFAVTVDEMEDGVMVCLDTQHRVLRTQNAYELLQELRHVEPQRFKELAHQNIIGSCIFTRYNNKTYIVDDIAWDMNPTDTFPTRDGSSISFVDYYKNQHNLKITDESQPLLVNRKSVKQSGSLEKKDVLICLVPEFSYLTGLTDTMRNDFKVMKDVAQYTRVTPNQRMMALRTYLDNVKKSQQAQEVLGNWGLTIADGSIDMHARQMDNEILFFGNDKQVRCNDNADWNREISSNNVTGPVDMMNWIVFYTQRDGKRAQEFAQTMCRLGGVLGCRIANPKMVVLADDRTETYMDSCKHNIIAGVQIVVFICPTMRTDRYTVIKKICCTQIPVASQVINSKTLGNPQKVRSIIVKIALQMTCKLGGTLWTVRFPFKGWMICGIDVYHGSPPHSVCGFVASLNESISRWFSVAMFQDKELGDFYKMAFTKVLEVYRNENGYFPSKIVIFRDGTGDGQLDQCKRYEIAQFESVLKQFELETSICFVVVQKRINARMFHLTNEGAVNPGPGSVLDHTITRRDYKDFFLVSQSVRQGTVNPTHYIVLYDTCQIPADRIQRLAYKLCHLYYNWAGTIRVPAPCQYAHKLAALVGQHIKKAPSIQLCDKLFYL